MTNARKKLKEEKKAKARKEKARLARARAAEARKAAKEHEKVAPPHARPQFKDGGQASSKPSGRPSSAVGHRTQGK